MSRIYFFSNPACGGTSTYSLTTWVVTYFFDKELVMKITNISEAKASLSHLIKIVQETDQPLIIGKAGKPVAVLSAFKEKNFPRTLGGSWEGKVKISDDFDAADKEISDRFYNSSIFPN
jgi:prevent-host-death family protein